MDLWGSRIEREWSRSPLSKDEEAIVQWKSADEHQQKWNDQWEQQRSAAMAVGPKAKPQLGGSWEQAVRSYKEEEKRRTQLWATELLGRFKGQPGRVQERHIEDEGRWETHQHVNAAYIYVPLHW